MKYNEEEIKTVKKFMSNWGREIHNYDEFVAHCDRELEERYPELYSVIDDMDKLYLRDKFDWITMKLYDSYEDSEDIVVVTADIIYTNCKNYIK